MEKKFYKVSPLWVGIFGVISSICVWWVWSVGGLTCTDGVRSIGNHMTAEEMICSYMKSLLAIISFSVEAACLLVACIMDVETHTVYNYIWLIMGASGAILLLIGNQKVWLSIFIFILLQECFFCKMYGRADCHGFAACALTGGAFGMGLKQYLLHMLIAFGLLGVVQFGKGNVGRNGNLKKPVPFLPYLTVAFWLNLGAYLCV